MHIVDRRLNPGGKSFANRQRFLRRVKDMVERAVREASREIEPSAIWRTPRKSRYRRKARENRYFQHTQGSRRDYILPGNREYVEGDLIDRPQSGGEGSGGAVGVGDRQEDAFKFVLTRDEFLNIFLEDLELPDFAKRGVFDTQKEGLRRAGYTTNGTPANLSLKRTMQMSLARRIALARPKPRHDRAIGGGTRQRVS